MSSKKTSTFPSDFSALIAAFDASGVDYMVVGGDAAAAHGRPRATKDLELFIAGAEELTGNPVAARGARGPA